MKYIVNLNGKNYEVIVEEGTATIANVVDSPVSAPITAPAPVPAPAPVAAPVSAPAESASAGETPVLAPLNGTVLNINVKAGDTVKASSVLLIIEAMKMEIEIVAPSDGTVKQIAISKGSQVDTNDLLVVLG